MSELLALSWAVATCWAGPLRQDGTFEECKSPSPLTSGQTLLYTYVGENRIENQDAKHNVQVRAQVEIGVLSPCLISMKMADVELQGVSVANRYAFKEALERHPVVVHIEDGIVGEMRHDPAELPWALNVKRAVISMMQMPRTAADAKSIISETDVFGTCDTTYSPGNMDRNGGTVLKSKNLASCFGRFGSSLPVIYTPYESKASPFQTIPMTNGTFSCQQTIDGNRWITKAQCTEREFLHFAARGTREQTIITSTGVLTMQRTFGSVKPIPETVTKKSTIKFDHSVTRAEKGDINDVMGLLRDLCRSSADDIRPEASGVFARLVAGLRGLAYPELKQIYSQISTGELCFDKKLEHLFLDALPLVGSEGSLKMTVELMNKAEHASRSTAWIAGITSISYPTEEMIAILAPLIKKADAPRSAVLAVTSLAHVFCRSYDGNCDTVPAIRDLQASLTKMLNFKCRATDTASRNKIITALKGFGNLGYYGDGINTIMECAVATGNPLPIRLAAIQATRRACAPEMHPRLSEMMRTPGEDVEIRIAAAYLGIMRCPTMTDVMEIKRMLEKEEINQVGSFIWSHLTNLQDTESPSKMALRSLVSGMYVPKKFESDARKASQNIEWSKLSEMYNVGGTAETNIIYSPKSFIPRSIDLNLTVDLFSHSINIFEFGGRAEGYDHLLESLLAPKSHLKRTNEVDSIWSRIGDRLSRSRRAASAKNTKVDIFDDKVNIAKPNDPSGSLYFRMFGNELSWFELPTMDDIVDFANGVRSNSWLDQMMSQKQNDIARSAMLVDTTGNGTHRDRLPVQGWTSRLPPREDLRLTGKINLAGAPKDMLIEGYIKPSASIDMSGLMSIDAGVAKRGIRVSSTMHTSTALDGKIEIKSTGEMNFKYNLRNDKQEILNMKTEIYSVDAETEQPLMAPNVKEFAGCTQTLSKALGVSLCARGKVPKPFFNYRGLNLPFDISLVMQKNDLSMEGYELKIKYPVTDFESSDNLFYQLIFDTPGSTVQRKHLIELSFNKRPDDERTMHFLYHCPMKKLELSTSLRTESSPALAMLEAKVDDARRYFIKLETPYGEDSEKIFFEPRLEMSCPHTQPVLVQGKIEVGTSAASINLRSNMPVNKPAYFRAIMMVEDTRMQLDMSSSLPSLEMSLNALSTKPQERSAITTATLEYQWSGQRKHTAKLDAKAKNLSTQHIAKSAVTAEMQFSQFPEYNWKVTTDFQKAPGAQHNEYDLKLWWGENLPEDQRHIQVLAISKQVGEYSQGSKGSSEGRLVIKAPVWDIDFNAFYNAMLDLQDTSTGNFNGEVLSHGEKLMQIEMNHNLQSRSPLQLFVSSRIETRHFRIVYSDQLEERNPNQYVGRTSLEWGREGKSIATEYVIISRQGKDSTLHDIEYKISYPGMRMPAVHRTKIRVTRQALDATSSTEVDGQNYVMISIQRTNKLREFRFECPFLQTKLSKTTKAQSVMYLAELRPRFMTPNALVSTMQIKGSPSTSLEVLAELLWDADGDVNQKMRITSNVVRTTTDGQPGYRYNGVFQYCTDLSLNINGLFTEDVIQGPHSIELGIGGTEVPPRTASLSYTRRETSANVMFGYTLNGADQIRIEYTRSEDHIVQQIDISVTSVYPEWNGKRLNIQRSFGRPIMFKIQYDHVADKIYAIEFSDDSRGNRINTNVKIRTPYPRYATQEFKITGDYSPATTNMIIEVTSSATRFTVLVSTMKCRAIRVHATLTMETPHENVRNGKITLRYDQGHQTTDSRLLIEFNDRPVFDLTGSTRYIPPSDGNGRISLKSDFTPDVEAIVSFRTISPENKVIDFKFIQSAQEVLVVGLQINDRPRYLNLRLDLSGALIQQPQFVQFEMKGLEQGHHMYTLTTGPIAGLTLIVDTVRSDDTRITTIKYQPQNRPEDWASLTVKNNDWTDYDKKFVVIVEPKANIKTTFDYLYYKSKDTLKSKFIWSLDENKLGYELKSRAEGETTHNSLLKILYFKREIDVHHSYVETPNSLDISSKVLLNAVMMPDRALSMTYRHNRIQNGWEAMAKLSHPTFVNDIVIKGQMQEHPTESIPLLASAEIQPGDARNKIYFTLTEKVNDQIATNSSIHMHVHHEDRNLFDASLTLYKTLTPEPPIFGGYYWAWTTPRLGPKRGHATLFVGRNGVARFDYDSFMGRWSASGESQRAQNGDQHVDIVLQGPSEQFRGRIIYNLRKYKFEGITFDSEGKTSRSLEFSASNNTRNAGLKVELSHFEGNNQMTDFSYNFEKRGDRSYRSKLFFPPEKVRALQAALANAGDKVSEINIAETAQDVADMTVASANYLDKNFLTPFTSLLLDEFGEMMGEVVIAISDVLYESPFGELLTHWQNWLDSMMKTLAEQIKNFLSMFVESVDILGGNRRRHRRDVSESWDELGDYVSSMMDAIWEAPLMRQITRKMDDAIDYMSDKLSEMMYRIRKATSDAMDAIKENPDYKAIQQTISELYEPGKYEGNTDFWKNLKTSMQGSFKTQPLAIWREADHQNGKYIVDFHLPADLDSMRQNWHAWLAEDDEHRRPKKDVDEDPDMVGYLSSMLQRKWMPPFDGQAMIIGNEHFVTFDGTMYSASGDCTYLLARDFVDGNFTVLLKYHPNSPRVHGRVPKSIIIQLGQSYIEIYPDDASVFLNGQDVDLPLILEDGEVIARRVDDVITVEDEKALRVSCHLYYGVCTVKVNGWYFGNTAGLLGTFNNERSDDLMKPKGQVTSNVAQFLKKWETSRGCKAPVNVLKEQAPIDSEGYKLCEKYFKDDDSPLAEGFWQESPAPFFDLCLRHMALPNIDPRQAICNVSMAYLMQLEKYSIVPSLPSECYSCAIPEGETLKFGEVRTPAIFGDVPRAHNKHGHRAGRRGRRLPRQRGSGTGQHGQAC
uniref:Vitellogenin-B n=1 Tax=Haemaphysalis longicornis TaxID=44386 RepID=G9M4L6_HAELO|nr:Vitellogenin-B [Haemaphysalis longicornis]